MKKLSMTGAVVTGVIYLAMVVVVGVAVTVMAAVFSGCAHNTQCRAPEDILHKKGVVLECSPGPVINGEPTKTCLVARPTGGALTVNVRVGNCNP